MSEQSKNKPVPNDASVVPTNRAVPTSRKLPPPPMMVEALREAIALGNDNPTMPETIFQQFIRALYDPVTDRFNTALWYQTTGDMRRGLNVLNEAGEVLFVCPPAMGTVVTKQPQPGAYGINHVVEEAHVQRQRYEPLGDKVLNEGLRGEGQHIVVTSVRDGWRRILARYDLLPESEKNTPTAGTSPAVSGFPTGISDDEIEL